MKRARTEKLINMLSDAIDQNDTNKQNETFKEIFVANFYAGYI